MTLYEVEGEGFLEVVGRTPFVNGWSGLKQGTHGVVLEFPLVQVHDVGAHTVQEVLGVGDEHQDTFEPFRRRAEQRESY